MKKILLLIILVTPFLESCTTNPDETEVKDQRIKKYLVEMQNNHSIPGMAVAVIKNDSVIHKGFYGTKTLKKNSPITEKTLFKVFSLTKTFVATGVFQLIEQGRISLDDKLSLHFEGMPKKWQHVTIANLLSHSSGLPDIRHLTKELANDSISDKEFVEMLYNDEMEFATNSQWNYNQTNYILLKMILEKVSGSEFETYIVKQQFPDSDKMKVLFASGADTSIINQATYYNYDKETGNFELKKDFAGRKNHPLAGINLTLDEYIKWNRRLDDGEHFSVKTKESMWTQFEFTESKRKFLHGWDVYTSKDYDSFGFSGGGVSGFRKYVDKDFTIIALTTGYKHYSVHNMIIDHIAGIMDESLKNDELVLTEKTMAQYFLKETFFPIEQIVNEVKQENPKMNLEEVFKSLGFTLFFDLGREDEAIELFEKNAIEYPESFDTHGSLAYLYFLTKQYKSARENYVKALELNPDNGYSERRIKEIDMILKSQKN